MPSIVSESFNKDNLIAGDFPIVTKQVTIISGAGVVVRGTVLGEIATGAATPAAGSNTGNGTLATATAGISAKLGVYALTCIAAATNAGTFDVVDPDGNRLDGAVVAVAYANDDLAFTIADGSTDFAVGDTFTITVAAGSGKYHAAAIAAVDGSDDPSAILLDADVDATSGDIIATAAITGEFNENKLVFGTGHSAATVREALRKLSIHLKAAQAA